MSFFCLCDLNSLVSFALLIRREARTIVRSCLSYFRLCFFINQLVSQSICLSNLSACLPIYLFICLFACQSVCQSACLSVYLSICLCLSVCLSVTSYSFEILFFLLQAIVCNSSDPNSECFKNCDLLPRSRHRRALPYSAPVHTTLLSHGPIWLRNYEKIEGIFQAL